jgi:hypothetical protein
MHEVGAINEKAQPRNWVTRVQRFVRSARAADVEYCDLCSQSIPAQHAHLVEPEKHRLLCVCQGCAVLLGDREDRKYVRVPLKARLLKDFHLSDAEWDALGIPIGLAYFYYGTPEKRILAFYPGPAGPTESLLSLDAWAGFVGRNPVLEELQADVEALLVNRIKNAREYYVVPIDRCYGLVGIIRTNWQGVTGGEAAWKAIGDFFATLRGPANSSGAPHG